MTKQVNWTDKTINWQGLTGKQINHLLNTWGTDITEQPAKKEAKKAEKKPVEKKEAKAAPAKKAAVKKAIEFIAQHSKPKQITLRVFSDPGHGWCRFPRERLNALGLAEKISSFSYQNGSNVFLEEDCDLGLLIDALKSKGYAIEFDSSTTNKQSKIRSYDSYKAAV